MSSEPTPQPQNPIGYRRALERLPHLVAAVNEFGKWPEAVEQWLVWIEANIPDNTHVSRAEALESLHVTALGLELLERLNLDIYPEGREVSRVEYDMKKLLRAVVALPTIARLKWRKLDRKGQTINTMFKGLIDDVLNGRADLDSISDWQPPRADESEPPSAASR
jgi:hypothetical protein